MRQFVADAGHELRTPLTIVLGYIDLLRRKADAGDERSRRIFSSISVEGARMRTLIDNLVLLAKMEGEDVRPPEPFDLRELIDEIVESRRAHPPRRAPELQRFVDAKGGRRSHRRSTKRSRTWVDNAFKVRAGLAGAHRGGRRRRRRRGDRHRRRPGDPSRRPGRDLRPLLPRCDARRGGGFRARPGDRQTRRRTRRRRADDRPHVTQGTTFALRLRADQVRNEPFRQPVSAS